MRTATNLVSIQYSRYHQYLYTHHMVCTVMFGMPLWQVMDCPNSMNHVFSWIRQSPLHFIAAFLLLMKTDGVNKRNASCNEGIHLNLAHPFKFLCESDVTSPKAKLTNTVKLISLFWSGDSVLVCPWLVRRLIHRLLQKFTLWCRNKDIKNISTEINNVHTCSYILVNVHCLVYLSYPSSRINKNDEIYKKILNSVGVSQYLPHSSLGFKHQRVKSGIFKFAVSPGRKE